MKLKKSKSAACDSAENKRAWLGIYLLRDSVLLHPGFMLLRLELTKVPVCILGDDDDDDDLASQCKATTRLNLVLSWFLH